MKTIILDGIEYVLIPKDQYLNQPEPISQPEVEELSLNDFVDESVPIESVVIPEEPVVKIVDATHISEVPLAQPKDSVYRSKFIKKQLSAADIVPQPNNNRSLVNNFQDLAVFAEDAQKPPNKQLFYGPGIEIDIPGV